MKQENISHLIELAFKEELKRVIKGKSKFSLALVKMIEIYMKNNKKQINEQEIRKILSEILS